MSAQQCLQYSTCSRRNSLAVVPRPRSCKVEIERQTEQGRYECSCSGNPSIHERQQQSQDKQKGSDIFHVQQGTCEPFSAELRPFEIGSISPYDDRAQQTCGGLGQLCFSISRHPKHLAHCSEKAAGLCPAGRTNASVPTCLILAPSGPIPSLPSAGLSRPHPSVADRAAETLDGR